MAIKLFEKKNKVQPVVDALKDAPEDPADGKKRRRKKPRVKKKGSLIKRILLILVLALLGALGFVGYKVVTEDLWGIRTLAIDKVNTLDPQYAQFRKQLEQEAEANRVEQQRLAALEEALKKEEQRLSTRKANLDKQEQDIIEREINRVPIYRQPMSEEALEEMKSVSRTYANMSPAEAATILATLGNIEDMTAIIYHMSERSAAAILTQMDVRLAAQITDLLLSE